MSQLIWKPQFEIGIEQIDRQHKLLLQHLNNCLSSVADIEDLFFDLKKYYQTHFQDEEVLMLKLGYPALARHKVEHEIFEARVQQLETSVLQKESSSISLSVDFLRNWFLDHILIADMEFANYLRSTMNDEQISDLFKDEDLSTPVKESEVK